MKEFNLLGPDLVLLDLMLPGVDGYQLCREIRQKSKVPIIILSAKAEVFDKVLGLELGADDYITKPFDTKELVARVRAVLRRYQTGAQPAEDTSRSKCIEYPDLAINLSNYSVTFRGTPVDMPPKELELLYFLASSPNQVFTREQLLDHIWGYEYMGDTPHRGRTYQAAAGKAAGATVSGPSPPSGASAINLKCIKRRNHETRTAEKTVSLLLPLFCPGISPFLYGGPGTGGALPDGTKRS